MPIKLTQAQVEQYQLCQKRLVDLARALQDYGTTVDLGKSGQGVTLLDFRVDEYCPDLSRTYDPERTSRPQARKPSLLPLPKSLRRPLP
jgi:hypothetical protein